MLNLLELRAAVEKAISECDDPQEIIVVTSDDNEEVTTAPTECYLARLALDCISLRRPGKDVFVLGGS